MSSKSDKRKRVLRKDRRGFNPFTVGLLVLLFAAVCAYAGFSKHVPFTHGFRVKAVFETSNNVRPNSPVRIAGVNVGTVKKVEAYKGGDGNAALVTMEINKSGLPIHKDATLKVRPRIFLEGNEFVDLSPGTPSAPIIEDGDTLPMTQTAAPVQFDQILSALQSSTRDDLKRLLDGYGTALTYQPTAADDVTQDPSVKGKTAAQALNASIDTAPGALRNASIVNNAFLGLDRHDLSGLVFNTGKVTKALARNETSLKDFVTNFNTTMAAFASRQSDLKQTIALLGPTLEHTNVALTRLNASFPATSAFAKAIIPGVKETPATIDASLPWIAQARKLLSKPELGGLITELKPTTVDLARLVDGSITALPQADLVSQCVTHTILPTGNIKIQDGQFTSNVENYKEFWYAMVGLAGEAQNFDGNGHYVRFAVGGGSQTLSTGKYGGNAGEKLYSNVNEPPLGTRPAYPGKRSPYNHTALCKDQQLPDLNGAKTGAADGGGGTPSNGGTQTQVATPTVSTPAGTVPSVSTPPLPATASAGSAKPSLTAQLVDRLNPFRATTGSGR
ncbi:MAG: phospholipid/cholesterol/gamma-HCH transport system substrate-binding protein [Baekduia sp.]|jgi:phospholipid/cholesterol/gamma-HCH transport system substrate-binding protein|nr:phospholipid/cholesterol/gamma-HCH transport system substrate-binding protein [Baekduia sp.]